jgi:flagellar basal body-associated protein FliL
MENQTQPPQGVSGKWIVIVIVPLVIFSAIWLIYHRWNFKHPTSLATVADSKPATKTP